MPRWWSTPWLGRIATYHRDAKTPADGDPDEPQIRAANPVPELFSDRLESEDADDDEKPSYEPEEIAEEPADDGDSGRLVHG